MTSYMIRGTKIGIDRPAGGREPLLMNLAPAHRVRGCRRRASLMARLMIVLFALIHGWGSYANAVSSSHDRAFRPGTGVAALEVHVSGHGHSHDVPKADDEGSERPTGHNAADHSHDKSGLPRDSGQASIALSGDWGLVCQAPPYPAPYFDFDRPPRRLSLH